MKTNLLRGCLLAGAFSFPVAGVVGGAELLANAAEQAQMAERAVATEQDLHTDAAGLLAAAALLMTAAGVVCGVTSAELLTTYPGKQP